MEQKQVKKIINGKLYKDPIINNSRPKLKALIDTVNKMKINQDTFKIIRILIRYFRFPILILFQPFFHNLQKDKDSIIEFSKDLKTTASIVVKIIQGKQFPSLSFYLRSGYDKNAGLKEFEPQTQNEKNFQKLISQIDKIIDSIIKDEDKYELDRIKFAKSQIASYVKDHPEIDQIAQLCIEAYSGMISEKQKQILHSLESFKIKNQFVAAKSNRNQTIYVQQGREMKQIIDLKVSQDYLCCRPYFYNNEVIQEPETLYQEYKSYSYPYNKLLNEILLKTIVGFLNGKGGIIYIGIRENIETKKRLIKGQKYNESVKEDVLKHFRHLGQRISPEIVNNQLYKLQYVPIKNAEGSFMIGQYVIRLKIQKGQKDDLYSFKNYDGEDYFAFRTANEVLTRKIGQEIIEVYRKRLTLPDEPQYSCHPGPCKKPDLGKQLYQNKEYFPNHGSNAKWIDKKAPSHPIKAKQTTVSDKPFYILVGDKIAQQLAKSCQIINSKTIIPAKNSEEFDNLTAIIRSLDIQKDYEKASHVINFQQQYFSQIWNLFQKNKILAQTNKPYRRQLILNHTRELICGIQLLQKYNIPFGFGYVTKKI